VRIRGKVFNIIDDGYQIWVDKSEYDAVPILVGIDADTEMPSSRIYIDDIITVYGVVLGNIEGTNAFGSSVSNAAILLRAGLNNGERPS
jgi:hypothetical protein